MTAVGIQTSTETLMNVNAQGSHFDPIEIKKSSAAKMRLADKTGNAQLRKEAAAEQSFADRLGGRTALLSDQIKLQIQQKQAEETVQKPSEQPKEEKPEVAETPITQPTPQTTPQPTPASTSTQTAPSASSESQQAKKNRKRNNRQQASDQEQAVPQVNIRQRQPLRPQSQPFTPLEAQSTSRPQPLVRNASVPANKTPQPALPQATALPLMRNASLPVISSWLSVTLPPEAIALKLDAATKQSLADKTGNLELKRTAALEQSLADKMAFICSPGITTAALHAGRKGFQLPQSAPVQVPPTQAPQVQQTQAPQVQQQPKQFVTAQTQTLEKKERPQRKGETLFLQQLLQSQSQPLPQKQQPQQQAQPQPQQKQQQQTEPMQIPDRAQIKELVAKQRIPQFRQQRTEISPKNSPPQPSRSDSKSWRQRDTSVIEPEQPRNPSPALSRSPPAQQESLKQASPRQQPDASRTKNNKSIDVKLPNKKEQEIPLHPLTPAPASM